jgi:hypothetical protein
MGNTCKKQNQDTDQVSKPKRHRTKPVGKRSKHSDRQPSRPAFDTHSQNSSSSETLQSPLSNDVPRKFYPSFLATSTGLDRAPEVVSNVTVEQANTIAVQPSRPVKFSNEPGKRWYDHNNEAKPN